jgi:type III pantothenate kinase
MITLIDIGNSRTKYVELIDGCLSKTSQLANNDFNGGYFATHFSQASKIVVANVAKSALTTELKVWCKSNNIGFTQVHSEQQKNTLMSAYQKPTQLGIDRWLALLAATHLYPNKNVLIIDAGTATTVDLVSGNGQHQGGWILAGIRALFNSILSHSTLVQAENKAAPSLAFGDNTTDNVNNACWAATLGMINQAIQQAQELGDIDQVVLTGGNGLALAELLIADTSGKVNTINKSISANNIEFIDNLIFYGLQEYCE